MKETLLSIVYSRPDGGVSVVTPAPEFLAQFKTQAEGMDALRERVVPPDATDVQIMDPAAVPADRTFRDAWRQSGGVFSTDMAVARVIHADRIATAHASEIARLKREEPKERLRGNAGQANERAARVAALEALDLNFLADRISRAPNLKALNEIWPADVPRQ